MDDTDPSSTPLDLLLNAITEDGETDQYTYQGDQDVSALGDLGGLLEESGYDFSIDAPRPEQPSEPPTPRDDPLRDEQLRSAITGLILDDAAPSTRGPGRTSRMSIIQVWHPTAAQKSYKNERRLILPPPFVRATGPISSSLSSLTLSSIPVLERPTDTPPPPSSSQTHRIHSHLLTEHNASPPPPLAEFIPPHLGKRVRGKEQRRLFREAAERSGFGLGLRMKSKEQIDKDREMLQAGVNFPALWIGGGEEKGEKMKGFRLVLDVHAQRAAGLGDESSSHQGSASVTATAGPSASSNIGGDTTDYTATLQDLANLHSLSSPIPHHSPTPGPPPTNSTPTQTPADQAWATLPSSPISIVSKPSIKTAKSRSVSSCLSETATFSLYVRIHAQSVRTKYMMLDESAAGARLTTRTGRWTPFRFEVVKRAELADARPGLGRLADDDEDGREGKVLTYGSIVRLVDVHSGTKSESVKLVKVEKNEVLFGSPSTGDSEADVEEEGKEEGQPISELQRIGMIRVDEGGNPVLEDGKRTYLSAPGARIGGGELRDPNEVKWVWIGRGKRIPVEQASTPDAIPSEEVTPPADPVTRLRRPMPETLDDAGMGEIDDTDLAHAFGLPGSDGVDISPAEHEPPAAEHLQEKEKEEEDKVEEPEEERPAKRLKTKRNALAAAVVAEGDEGAEQTVCTWQGAERRTSEREVKVGKEVTKRKVEVEYVEDWMCWIIAGVAEFTHTFYDSSPETNSSAILPKSITPAPRLLRDPNYPTPTTLQLTLSSFFSSPTSTSRPMPLSIYLGPLGPLPATTWRSTWRTTSLKHPTRGPATPCLAYDGEVTSPPEDDATGGVEVKSTFSALVEHVIVLVELPKVEEVGRVIQALQSQMSATQPRPHHQSHQPTPQPSSSRTLAESSPTIATANAIAAAAAAHEDAAWMDAVTGFDSTDIDGNEAIRQALQSVSQAADMEEAARTGEANSRNDTAYTGGEMVIDPELQGLEVPAAAGGLAIHREGAAGAAGSGASVHLAQPDTGASRVVEDTAGLPSLPLLLVRRDDEMIFGLGKSMVLERKGQEDVWDIRLIATTTG